MEYEAFKKMIESMDLITETKLVYGCASEKVSYYFRAHPGFWSMTEGTGSMSLVFDNFKANKTGDGLDLYYEGRFFATINLERMEIA